MESEPGSGGLGHKGCLEHMTRIPLYIRQIRSSGLTKSLPDNPLGGRVQMLKGSRLVGGTRLLRCALDGVSTSQKKRTLRPRTVVKGYCSIELKVMEKKLDAYTILLPQSLLSTSKVPGSASNLISHGGLHGRAMAQG